MWELDHTEGWAPKNWLFQTAVLEETLFLCVCVGFESPLDSKEIKPVHPKGNQSWIFTGRTDVKAEVPTLWPPDASSWLIGKDPDAGKDWRQKEKGVAEDETVRYPYLSMDMNWSKLWEMVKDWEAWHAAVYRVTKSQIRFNDWITTNMSLNLFQHLKEKRKKILEVPQCFRQVSWANIFVFFWNYS